MPKFASIHPYLNNIAPISILILLILSIGGIINIVNFQNSSSKHTSDILASIPDGISFLKAAQFVDNNTPMVFGTEQPDEYGALGLNKVNGQYSSVRWQMGIFSLTVRALSTLSEDDINSLNQVIKYSFDHQRSDGSFEFEIPSNLRSLNKSPNKGDLASGASFFLSSLGNSLNLIFENQDLLTSSDSGMKLLKDLETLKPKFILSLNWLQTQSEILKKADSRAPNRLLFNSLAYYSLGKYTQSSEAKELGLDFLDIALLLQNDQGEFDENGFDSSYQAVNIVNLQHLYFTLRGEVSSTVLENVLDSIERATKIESTKILSSGEISTAGNGRVFNGGEKFLGQEKQIAVPTVIQSFGYSAYIFKDIGYQQISVRIYSYHIDRQ